MDPRRALVIAIVAAAGAVAIVAASTVYGLDVRLDTRDGEEWRTVSVAPGTSDSSGRYASPYFFEGCANPELRLVVDNHQPFAKSVEVVARYSNMTGDHRLFRETWDLEAFDAREKIFTVPEGAFTVPPRQKDDFVGPYQAQVMVSVGTDLGLYTCVQKEAMS